MSVRGLSAPWLWGEVPMAIPPISCIRSASRTRIAVPRQQPRPAEVALRRGRRRQRLRPGGRPPSRLTHNYTTTHDILVTNKILYRSGASSRLPPSQTAPLSGKGDVRRRSIEEPSASCYRPGTVVCCCQGGSGSVRFGAVPDFSTINRFGSVRKFRGSVFTPSCIAPVGC